MEIIIYAENKPPTYLDDGRVRAVVFHQHDLARGVGWIKVIEALKQGRAKASLLTEGGENLKMFSSFYNAKTNFFTWESPLRNTSS